MATGAPPHPPAAPGHHPRAWLLALGVMGCVFLARIIYVSLYGATIPFWDQWDELNHLIGPWVQDRWHAAQLFSAHNEHRIAFTRLISLSLFGANGGIWDNLVESYANTFIYACTLALLYALLCRGGARRVVLWTMFIAVVVVGSLPFDWENTLVGFQNQFYLMEISAITLVGIASYRPAGRTTFWLLLVLGTVSLFTMAAGLLAAAAVCAIVALRWWCNSLRLTFFLSALTGMLLVVVSGIALLPHGASNGAFVARGLEEHFRAWVVVLMWPVQSYTWAHSLFALLIWSPTLLWLLRLFRVRQASGNDVFAVGITLWVLFQAFAIAHARGHGLVALPSRYMEIPAIGLLGNLWLALRMPYHPTTPSILKLAGTSVAVLGIVLIAITLAGRTQGDLVGMRSHYSLSEVETRNVRAYLASDNLIFLQQPALLIPYPDATKLRNFLDNPFIRAALPAPIRPPPKASIRRDLNAEPPLQLPTSQPVGLLSISAGRLQRSIRNLSRHLGVVLPATLYEELPSASTSNDAGQPSEGRCALDQINFAAPRLVTVAGANGPLQVNGWLVDARKNAPISFMLMLVGPKTYEIEGKADMPRVDVAAALHSEAASNAGFSVIGTLDRVIPGTYEIKLKVNGTEHLLESMCDTHHQVAISNQGQNSS